MIIVEPINPVAINLLGLQIRWYALAYIAAFIVGFWLVKKLIKNQKSEIRNQKSFDNLMSAVILGVILGGRLGYVLFYNLPYFLENPWKIFAVWQGGMSFHGGLIGVIVAVFLFVWKSKAKENSPCVSRFTLYVQNIKNAFGILDILAVVAPLGLFFGRIANFINMEVMGRATDVAWGITFAGSLDQTPRHPSPLYEAGLEGILLFVIMFALWRTRLRNRAGVLSGIFAILYAVFRIFAEQFRQPDEQLGFLTSWGLTMGQLLSGVMLLAGATVLVVAYKLRVMSDE
ncbi:prolipoprotein diacylglyceryl transferase [Bacteroidia bacterium]|nr:prolipoprotein diacylglyceryl transferase [Bacteroidia bacterium]